MEEHKKTKLIFVNLSLNIGGIETLILEMCKRLDHDKYSPQVCVLEKNGVLEGEFSSLGIPVDVVEKRGGFDISLIFRLAGYFKKARADIVHTHNHSVWLYGGLAAKWAGVRLVHTEHTSAHYNSKRWDRIERYLSYFTNRITTVSESVGRYMIEHERIAPSKIKVIHNGIDTQPYAVHSDPAKIRNELNIKENDLIIGNVARLSLNKDHVTLLRAFRLIANSVPQAKLLIAGEGALKKDLLDLRGELGLDHNAFFLGNRRDIPELLKSFDIFALSSIKEGLPITILEAMASGLPVLCTDVDGNPEVVTDNVTGFIVPARNPALFAQRGVELLTDKDKRIKMGEKGRERAANEFSFDKMISQYDALYTQVLGSQTQ